MKKAIRICNPIKKSNYIDPNEPAFIIDDYGCVKVIDKYGFSETVIMEQEGCDG